MSGDTPVVSGDLLVFEPAFGAATVVAPPATMTGSTRILVRGRAVCAEGDESAVVVAGVPYLTPQYPVVGVGVIRVKGLGGDQTSARTTVAGRACILVGGQCDAVLQVLTPAQRVLPSGPEPDTTTSYDGHGRFVSSPSGVWFV